MAKTVVLPNNVHRLTHQVCWW